MKKLLGFLMGAIITGAGVLGAVDVGAMTVENPSLVTKNPRYSGYTDKVLIRELGISDVSGGAYFVYALNDTGYFGSEGFFGGINPRLETIMILTEDQDGKQIVLGNTVGVLPVQEGEIRIEATGGFWAQAEFDFGEMLVGGGITQLLMRVQGVEFMTGVDRWVPYWSDTVLDLADCMKFFESGATCRVQSEEVHEIVRRDELGFGRGVEHRTTERVVYYGVHDESEKVVQGGDDVEGGSGGRGGDGVDDGDGQLADNEAVIDGGRGGDGGGASGNNGEEEGVVEKTDDEFVTDEEYEESGRVARSFAVVENNETDESAERTEGEVLGEQVVTGYEDEEPEVPSVGQTEVGLSGVWMFWLVGLVSVMWLVVVIFKRRKEQENKKAIANIVAETRK